MSKKKPMEESETRKKLMEHARRLGAESDLQQLFDRWDRAIALAPPSEKGEMSKLAILAVQQLLDVHAEDGLTINDEVVIEKTDRKDFIYTKE
jgi:hypothetical protein